MLNSVKKDIRQIYVYKRGKKNVSMRAIPEIWAKSLMKLISGENNGGKSVIYTNFGLIPNNYSSMVELSAQCIYSKFPDLTIIKEKILGKFYNEMLQIFKFHEILLTFLMPKNFHFLSIW